MGSMFSANATVTAVVDIELGDLVQALAENVDRRELMAFILELDRLVEDYGFTAELQGKLQAALNREDTNDA